MPVTTSIPGRPIGHLILSLLIPAVIAAAAPLPALSQTTEARIDDRRVPSVATDRHTLSFEFVGHLFVDAVVNGRRAELLYDPIRHVMLDRTYGRRQGFPMVGGAEVGYGGPVTTGGAGAAQHEVLFVRNVSLQLGQLSFEYPVAPVIPLDSIMASALGRHVDGLLGINVLSEYVLEFDFSSERFILHPFPFDAPDDVVSVPITWMERRPTIPMRITIDGTETRASFLLDFGMSGAVRFTTRYTDEKNLVDRLQPTIPIQTERGMGGALSSHVARLPRLRIGDVAMDSIAVSLARETEGADAAREWDGLIGLDLLSRFQLFLDLKNDRLWLRPNTRFDRPFQHVDAGLTFEPRQRGERSLIVGSVRKGSEADEAGFAAGDVVLSVAGASADAWHVRHWRETLETRVGRRVPVVVRRDPSQLRLDLDVRSGI